MKDLIQKKYFLDKIFRSYATKLSINTWFIVICSVKKILLKSIAELLLARDLEFKIFVNFNFTKMPLYLSNSVKIALMTFAMFSRYFEAKIYVLCLQTAAWQDLQY